MFRQYQQKVLVKIAKDVVDGKKYQKYCRFRQRKNERMQRTSFDTSWSASSVYRSNGSSNIDGHWWKQHEYCVLFLWTSCGTRGKKLKTRYLVCNFCEIKQSEIFSHSEFRETLPPKRFLKRNPGIGKRQCARSSGLVKKRTTNRDINAPINMAKEFFYAVNGLPVPEAYRRNYIIRP